MHQQNLNTRHCGYEEFKFFIQEIRTVAKIIEDIQIQLEDSLKLSEFRL